MSDHDTNPQPAGTEPVQPAGTEPATTAPQDSTPKPRRTRGLLIAGGVLAAVLVAGGGVAAGMALEDADDDDRTGATTQDADDDREAAASDDSGSDDDSTSGDSGSDDSTSGDSNASGTGTGRGSDSADEITALIAAASELAEGEAVDIDAKRNGSWEVTLETADGDESEVSVAADGTARVIASETAGSDDRGPEHVLDAETIAALVEAALADTDGTIVELDSGDGPTPYDITVLTADGGTVDLELSSDLAVSSRDADD